MTCPRLVSLFSREKCDDFSLAKCTCFRLKQKTHKQCECFSMVASPPSKTIHTSFHFIGDGRIAPNWLAMGFWRCCFSFLERLHHTDSPQIWHSCGLAFLELRSLKMGGIFIHANCGFPTKVGVSLFGGWRFFWDPNVCDTPKKVASFFCPNHFRCFKNTKLLKL